MNTVIVYVIRLLAKLLRPSNRPHYAPNRIGHEG